MVETGPGAAGKSSENKSAFPTPSARRASEDPVSPVASVLATVQKFQVGQTHLEGQHSPFLPLLMSYFVFKLASNCLNMTHRKLPQNFQWHTEINVYFLLTYVLVGWSGLSWVWPSLCPGFRSASCVFCHSGICSSRKQFLWPYLRESTCNTGDLGSIPGLG